MRGRSFGLCVLSAVAVTFACLFVLIVGAGCQTAGTAVSEQKDVMCPDCSAVAVTSSIKGINVTSYKCPACRKTYQIDTSGGYLPPKEVLVCSHCSAMVMECPACKAKYGM